MPLHSKTLIERLLRRMVLLGILVEDTYRQANEFAAVQSAIRVRVVVELWWSCGRVVVEWYCGGVVEWWSCSVVAWWSGGK